MIKGTGNDIIEIARIAKSYERYGARLLQRVFTEGEAAYCAARKRIAQHLAVRFAAKEAVAKALGTGIKDGVSWRGIEVVRAPGAAPQIVLHGGAAAVAEKLGVKTMHISLSHSDTHAIAFAIAEG